MRKMLQLLKAMRFARHGPVPAPNQLQRKLLHQLSQLQLQRAAATLYSLVSSPRQFHVYNGPSLQSSLHLNGATHTWQFPSWLIPAAAMASSLAMVALLLVSCAAVAAATKYTVGDTSGWAMGLDYTTWASDKKFKIGDTLVFNYAGGAHSVDEVSAADYAACTTSNALQSDGSGTTTITLKTAGKHYFICGVAGHCSNGMKLLVDVAAASPAPAPKAPSTTPTTPSTTPETPETPASPGSSSGVTPKTPATVLAPPVKQSADAAGLRAGSWAILGLVGLATVQLGFF